jgi:hypothetical protein
MAFIIGGTTGALIGAGALGAAGSIAGSAIGAGAASDAAAGQSQAAHEANALQEKMYNQTRADQEPWRQAGIKALGGMQDADYMRDFGAGDFTKDPGYDFRLSQGMKGVENSAAARGGLLSGRTAKALNEYGQNFASNEYNNAYNRFNADRDRRFNRLSTLAGTGQTATQNVNAAGMNSAASMGSNMMGAANAQGAAGMAGANAWGNTLSGLGKMGVDYAMMNKFFPGK